MVRLLSNKISGDKFIVNSTGTTASDGYNSIADRVNNHYHDGIDTEPISARDDLETQLVILDYATKNAQSAPYQYRTPRKMTADMVNSAGTGQLSKLATTLNIKNASYSTNTGIVSNVWVPTILQTTTNIASDSFTNTNNWRIITTGAGFFTAAGGNVYLGSAGVGTAQAMYSAASFTVNNSTMMEFQFKMISNAGTSGIQWQHHITRSNDSVTVARIFDNDVGAGTQISIGGGTAASAPISANDSVACRISQINASNIFVEYIKNGSSVQHAGYVSNGSTVNTFNYNVSYAKTAGGTDSQEFDDFVVNRATGYQEGYATFTVGNNSLFESTNINRVYGVVWPYSIGSGSNVLQSYNYSASSDNGATWTSGITDLTWNTLTSTTGKNLIFRISMGNNSSMVLTSAAFAWANAST